MGIVQEITSVVTSIWNSVLMTITVFAGGVLLGWRVWKAYKVATGKATQTDRELVSQDIRSSPRARALWSTSEQIADRRGNPTAAENMRQTLNGAVGREGGTEALEAQVESEQVGVEGNEQGRHRGEVLEA